MSNNEDMQDQVTERMFRGQARLVRLLLWKVGESTDLGACFKAAQDQRMISVEDAAFLRDCLDAEERCRDAEKLDCKITPEMVTYLQRCANRLNRADSA